MWCSYCEQDVPGIASQSESDEVICCARCGELFTGQRDGSEADGEASEQQPAPLGSFTADMPSWDDWELDERLHDVDCLVNELGSHSMPNAASNRVSQWPPGDKGNDDLASSYATVARKRQAAKAPRRRKRSSWLAWIVLGLGLMTFVCGSVLLGWSFFAEKALLWRVGLPLSLIGQAGLLIGLILQLEGLWQNDHEATESLDELDEQIRELRHAAAMLNASHSNAGQSFYLHMAEGASPHIMLADLKNQLDLLAVQMEKQRR